MLNFATMNLPNTITLIRLIIHIILIALMSISPAKFAYPALILFIISSFMDKLDGIVARATNTSTDLGRFLDGTVDKISSLTTMAVFTVLSSRFPIWYFLLLLSRDLTVEGLRQFISLNGVFPKGQMSGKIKVFLQMIIGGIGFFLFTPLYSGQNIPIINTSLLALQVISLVLGYYSLILYFIEAGKSMKKKPAANKSN